MRRRSTRRFLTRLAPLALFVLAACATNAPQDALDCAGPVCQQADTLFRPVFWIATVVFVLVEGAIVFAVIKFRDRPGREEPKQIHGNNKLEFAWTLIPALLMAGVAVPTVATIFDADPVREDGDLQVRVIAKQWWWEYEYLNVGTEPLITANELVIPTNREVYLELESTDVIHSFWIPRLAGKQDVVPGRTNTMELLAPDPGIFEGQCAEFCGISHANMRIRVRALDPGAFTSWLSEQQSPAVEPTTPDAQAGKALFFSPELADQLGNNNCIACHAIGGTDAVARVGPDLTHFADRSKFAGTMFDNTEQNVFDWIKNTRELKPGVLMPVFEGLLTDEQIRLLTAYVRSLR